MAVKEAALEGFRGGLAARRNPLEFGDEQWSKLHGFVIEDGGVPRSQWPLQQVQGPNSPSAIEAIGVYHGPAESPFLVAVLANGEVWWRAAPDDDAESGSSDLTTSWYQLQTEGGSPSNVQGAQGLRPIATMPVDAGQLQHASGGLIPCLMLNTISMDDTDEVWFVYEDVNAATEAETLRGMTLGSSAMWPVDDETEASPKGEHGTVWNGVLVLGDIEWKADPSMALASSNKTRYRNGLWLSVPGEVLLFDPLSVLFIGDANTRISGVLETDQGLLVFSTSEEGRGGLHILRGTPDAFTLEPLHVGIGISEGQTIWQDTATYCWVTDAGEVWQTDTDRVRRLDLQGLGVDRQRSPRDGVRAFGPWLMTVRERRMFVLRALDDGKTAAWTEAQIDSLAGPPDMRFCFETGQAFYFLAGNEVYRFTRADIRTGDSERGMTPDGLADLSVGSRTLATGKGHSKTFWHRVGVRATAGRRGTAGQIKRILLRNGPVLDSRSQLLTRVGPWNLAVEEEDLEGLQYDPVLWAGTPVTWGGAEVIWNLVPQDLLPVPTHSGKRWQTIVRGIGASNEFSAEIVCSGDVQMEQISVFFNGSILGGDEEGR